jgi:hypothetical protein
LEIGNPGERLTPDLQSRGYEICGGNHNCFNSL